MKCKACILHIKRFVLFAVYWDKNVINHIRRKACDNVCLCFSSVRQCMDSIDNSPVVSSLSVNWSGKLGNWNFKAKSLPSVFLCWIEHSHGRGIMCEWVNISRILNSITSWLLDGWNIHCFENYSLTIWKPSLPEFNDTIFSQHQQYRRKWFKVLPFNSDNSFESWSPFQLYELIYHHHMTISIICSLQLSKYPKCPFHRCINENSRPRIENAIFLHDVQYAQILINTESLSVKTIKINKLHLYEAMIYNHLKWCHLFWSHAIYILRI